MVILTSEAIAMSDYKPISGDFFASDPPMLMSIGCKVKKPSEQLTLKAFTYLAPRPGLEPGTYGLTVRRSTD